MKKANKKGMTLVEVIVAMALLGIISGMLCSAYVYSNNARVATYNRVTEENAQATDIEQFNYKQGAVDYSTANLSEMISGATNEYEMTFDFGAGTAITNTSYGFSSTSTELSESGFDLKFFTPTLNIIDLSTGEYWISIDSDSASVSDELEITAVDSNAFLFDAGKNNIGNTATISASSGTSTSFGIDFSAASSTAITVTNIGTGAVYSIDANSCISGASESGGTYATMYFNGSALSKDAFTDEEG